MNGPRAARRVRLQRASPDTSCGGDRADFHRVATRQRPELCQDAHCALGCPVRTGTIDAYLRVREGPRLIGAERLDRRKGFTAALRVEEVLASKNGFIPLNVDRALPHRRRIRHTGAEHHSNDAVVIVGRDHRLGAGRDCIDGNDVPVVVDHVERRDDRRNRALLVDAGRVRDLLEPQEVAHWLAPCRRFKTLAIFSVIALRINSLADFPSTSDAPSSMSRSCFVSRALTNSDRSAILTSKKRKPRLEEPKRGWITA